MLYKFLLLIIVVFGFYLWIQRESKLENLEKELLKLKIETLKGSNSTSEQKKEKASNKNLNNDSTQSAKAKSNTKFIYIEVTAMMAYVKKIGDDFKIILYEPENFATDVTTVNNYSENEKYRLMDKAAKTLQNTDLFENDINIHCYECVTKPSSYVKSKKAFVFDSYKEASIHRSRKY